MSQINKPKVSVIIATYNRSALVTQAIDSVLAQTFRDFELILVDDGSCDNTRDALKRYTGKLLYIYQENKGRAEARNAGIRQARGEYVAFLDDDDIWLPHKLEKQVVFLDAHPDIGLAHSFIELIDEGGYLLVRETKKHIKLYKKAMKLGYTYEGMSKSCVMFLSTVTLRKGCLAEVGLFDPDIPAFEDWDFYLRFALKYRLGTMLESLVRYRLHKAQTTKPEFILGRIKVSMKHLARVDPEAGSSCDCLRHNFYIHLSNAYYIDKQFKLFRKYALKTIKLKPIVLLNSRLGLHLLKSLIHAEKINFYPERIIPKDSSSGPLAVHLKRYELARQFSNGKVILDAACGVGYGAYFIAEGAKEVIGVDKSDEAIIYAKNNYQKENIQFKVMDIHNLEFPDKYFDLVCSFETVEHLDNPQVFLGEVKRVLKEEGRFIVSTPLAKRTTLSPRNPYHKIEFSYQEFKDFLQKYFTTVEILGERRIQSTVHNYLQRLDFLHLRAILPVTLRRKICHSLATRSWDEAGLTDFVINKEKVNQATELIGICR